MSKIKLELKCIYGKKSPGQVVEVEQEQADKMIASGAAKLKDENTLPSLQEMNSLRGQLTKANNEITSLKEKNELLSLEIEKLKEEK